MERGTRGAAVQDRRGRLKRKTTETKPATCLSGEGWEGPGPKKTDCEEKFVATSKTGKAVTQRRKEEKS
jgi:hypothetical protein